MEGLGLPSSQLWNIDSLVRARPCEDTAVGEGGRGGGQLRGEEAGVVRGGVQRVRDNGDRGRYICRRID